MTDLSGSDLRLVLDEEIACLPEKYRSAIGLCHLEGRSVQDVAQQIGCPRGTLLSWLARARHRLHGRLARRGVVLSAGMLVSALPPQAAPAALPAAWANAAIQSALRSITSPLAVGAVPATAVALSESVVRSMFLSKWKIVTALLLGFGVLGGAALLGYGAWTRRSMEKEQNERHGTVHAVAGRQRPPAADLAAHDRWRRAVGCPGLRAVLPDGACGQLDAASGPASPGAPG
jgi:transposase-like protein